MEHVIAAVNHFISVVLRRRPPHHHQHRYRYRCRFLLLQIPLWTFDHFSKILIPITPGERNSTSLQKLCTNKEEVSKIQVPRESAHVPHTELV